MESTVQNKIEIANLANQVYPRLKERFKLHEVSISKSTARVICDYWLKSGLVRRVNNHLDSLGTNIPNVYEKINER